MYLCREDGLAFSSLCNGVRFLPLTPSSEPRPPYECPALHTFWTSCIDSSLYRAHHHQVVTEWLTSVRGDGVGTLVVYVVTAEVRTKRGRTRTVEERIRTDFKGRADE